MIMHFCPVCWEPAFKTMKDNIQAHLDGANNECPGSARPFTVAITVNIGKTLRHIFKAVHELQEALAA